MAPGSCGHTAAELRGGGGELLVLGHVTGVRKQRKFTGHPFLGRRSDYMVYSGLELCACVGC